MWGSWGMFERAEGDLASVGYRTVVSGLLGGVLQSRGSDAPILRRDYVHLNKIHEVSAPARSPIFCPGCPCL